MGFEICSVIVGTKGNVPGFRSSWGCFWHLPEAGVAKDEMPGLSWWRGEGIFKEDQSCFGKKQNKG